MTSIASCGKHAEHTSEYKPTPPQMHSNAEIQQ